jgi:hypothetical protein
MVFATHAPSTWATLVSVGVIFGSSRVSTDRSFHLLRPASSWATPLFNPNSTLAGMGVTVLKKGAQSAVNALTPSDPTRHYGEVARALTEQGGARDARLQSIIDAVGNRQSNAAAAPGVGNVASIMAAIAGKSASEKLRNDPKRSRPQP